MHLNVGMSAKLIRLDRMFSSEICPLSPCSLEYKCTSILMHPVWPYGGPVPSSHSSRLPQYERKRIVQDITVMFTVVLEPAITFQRAGANSY